MATYSRTDNAGQRANDAASIFISDLLHFWFNKLGEKNGTTRLNLIKSKNKHHNSKLKTIIGIKFKSTSTCIIIIIIISVAVHSETISGA